MEGRTQTTASALSLDAPGVEQVPRVLEDVLRRLGAAAVFGEPIRSGETMVIPVAEVRVGFGVWSGIGRRAREASGSPGRGGGRGRVVPRGYIHVRPDGAHFEPIPDHTTLLLGAMAAAAAIVVALLVARA